MAMSKDEIDFESVRVKKEDLAKLFTCSICNNIFNDPVNITKCLHIFCNRCISTKIQEDDLNSCPVCKVYLGCMPLDKLRPDHNWSSIRAAIFPSLGQAEKQDDELEYKENGLLNGEAEQPITVPAKRKQRSLSSLENKVKSSGSNCMGRQRKSIARKALPSEGSATFIQDTHKSVEAHSESIKPSMNLNNCVPGDKQSSKKQITTIARERTQRCDKKIELVNNLLKPVEEMAETEKNENDKTVPEEDVSSKLMNISKTEDGSSEKNLRSDNADVANKSTQPSLPILRPVRKNRGRPRKTVEPQGLIHAQTIVDTTSSQHAKRVVPIWLSLISSDNQEGVEQLPQIPRCYLMIKNVTLTISFIKKYLVQKLGLDREDEVEISLWGMCLPQDLELHQLADMWSQAISDSEKLQAAVGDSAEEFVMVLTYGRKHPDHQ
ncbi:RING-type domain-containing protein [Heracleum sosnowskyi]|uniref:RING-type domain-containing protein n=1 Tax=Heracleum sosnowskyi TaxID=360622 RepID=A0AAD8IT73_9APIA|nr:RING-type domain-containing protein [Heracleum sosnowskyi]